MTVVMPAITLPSGRTMPVLGQGTWYLGESPGKRQDEIAALRTGLDLGMTMIDTAEMYGGGSAEELVASAIAGRRDEVFLVDKVLPVNATRQGTVQACRRSLRRLGTDHIDLYLLHWRGSHPLAGTIEAFAELVAAGDIGQWGVSNFDLSDMVDLMAAGGTDCAANQILYNLTRRGPEYDLLPWLAEHRIPVLAYSPIEQGRLLGDGQLSEVAARHRVTPAQVALAWVLRQDSVAAIPRSSDPGHTRENAGALELRLGEEDLAALDAVFPPPSGPQPLEML
ncbi:MULTISPECIES: aldo/keto reductase [unclassified Plantactinospora]|uniref:aldo/keto reductase n=1 Tax=unclassified Plantactinospora TaxID=2631981 RepID=UPI000D154973|nr:MULTISPECIES: aldo/keto reductase [unclassified Plantactinospora]AVT29524.1 oxidoreductase [Plantactinospora sp. BC1]AVT35933.1 oxidoreductase [Plantactinospora sp. BB1]